MLELVAESFAPWSEKARWALDHHRIHYDYREYVPLIDEPWLRWRVGALTGRVSTPTLLADGASYRDSFAIAEYAERRGSGPSRSGRTRDSPRTSPTSLPGATGSTPAIGARTRAIAARGT